MHSSNFSLRGIPQPVMKLLKAKAADGGISLNVFILNLLEQATGYSEKAKKVVHHDLDSLAGTWLAEEYTEFNKSIKNLETIDEELWQ